MRSAERGQRSARRAFLIRTLHYDSRVAACVNAQNTPSIVPEIAHADIVFRTLGYKPVGIGQFQATWRTCLGEDLPWKLCETRNIWRVCARLRDAGVLHSFEDPSGQWMIVPSALLQYTVANWNRVE